MINSNDTIGNRTRDLQACSGVPQPTEPTRAPKWIDLGENGVVILKWKGVQCTHLLSVRTNGVFM